MSFSFMIVAQVLALVACIVLSFRGSGDVEGAMRYNEAVLQFNELSLEQRQLFSRAFFDADDYSLLDKEDYRLGPKEVPARTEDEATRDFFLWLFGFSAGFCLIYWRYCQRKGYYLADFPCMKRGMFITLLFFLLTGWPFFAVSFWRMRKAKQK